MKRVAIKTSWTMQDAGGTPLPPRVLDLLVQVHAHGSLQAACQQLGLSYRHAWDLVRQGEAHFGATLLHMERGKGSTLSALGEKLVWADHRIAARLRPVLDSLANELANEIGSLIASDAPMLRIQASHGYAVEALVEHLMLQGLRIETRYGSSTAAAAALRDGSCNVAGFHVPLGATQDTALAHYWRWLGGGDLVVVDLADRRQGLMVPAGNPKKIYELADLARPGLRFINRQPGSGTRLLLEGLLRLAGVASSRIAGFEQGEFTHAAVAAYVASGMADAGFGLAPAARQFRLDFIPVASERYFLLCHADTLQVPAMQALLATLRSAEFVDAVAALPGYEAPHCGVVTPLDEAFPSRR